MRTAQGTLRAAAVLVFSIGTGLGAGSAEAGSTAAQVAFTQGVLAFENGENEEASRLFAEAVGNAPDEGTFLHWLGLAKLRLGRAADAVAHLQESLKVRRPPAAGRARVKEDLRLARAALAGGTIEVTEPEYRPEVLRFGEPPRWGGWIGFESGWDSNPELVTEDSLIFLSDPALPAQGVPSDAVAYLDIATAFQPWFDRRGWSLGIGLTGHQSKYQDLQELDLSMLEGAASLSWGGDPRGRLDGPLGSLPVPAGQGRLAVLLQAGGSQAWLSGDLYRSAADAAVSLFIRETPATATQVGVVWSDRSYSAENPFLLRPSGEELYGSVDQWISLGQPDRSLRLGVAAGRYDAARMFERTFREMSAEVAMPLAPRWTFYLEGSVWDDDYANPESNLTQPSASPRQDTTWRAVATAVWNTTDRFSWSLRASHSRRSSNVENPFAQDASLLDYERTVVSLGVGWLF